MQDIAPRGQRGLVGGEQHRATALVTFVDDVEQDVGGVGSVGQVADLVDDQNVRLQPLAQPTALRHPGFRCDIGSPPDCRPILILIVAPHPDARITGRDARSRLPRRPGGTW